MAHWEEVLDEIVRTRRRALVGYAYLLTGDVPAAEDLVQDALYRTFRTGRAATDFALAESYVRRAVLTVFLDGTRRRRRWDGVRHLLAAPGTSAPAEPAVEARVDVVEALAVLSPRERACVVLRYYSDLPVRDVAERLGLSEGTVKRYLSDANAKLAARLGPLRADEGDDLPVAPVRPSTARTRASSSPPAPPSTPPAPTTPRGAR
ncbi:sigma-70 family RNA polymerase sigma factor [Cellulosimicrobium sp. BIT-GX5]|uniref:Sigma-70 family RNA polymerase sigma factor n=1 Tax=Cellulosimicrobium composti TaxID=2672572 RepID=A0A6N7ZJQ4_9MICO|nr:sigma-70 family RNA polymerase sigma factor [Cellulosimicrobium composti]MTG89637.1 sigma-70 family RNA polymerase sigma factor [Cellulosimicrobium composti]